MELSFYCLRLGHLSTKFAMFKSTEKHLALLKLPFGVIGKANKRNYYSANQTIRPSSRWPLKNYNGHIRIKLTQSKSITTVHSPKDISLINQDKPLPDELKEQTAKLNSPLTYPRFLKSEDKLPSVTRVLSDTMPATSRFMLEKWKESMIKKLGADGFAKYQRDTFERGRMLHSVVANYLMANRDPVDSELTLDIVTNLWKSIQNVVKNDISNVRMVEHVVTHQELRYRGIVDCVAFYKNELVVIDFKTAEKTKKTVESLYDNPVQVSAYCGAINSDRTIPRHVIDRNICAGLVIVAYVDGSEASVYYIEREKLANDYWMEWNKRLDQYNRLEALRKDQKGKSSDQL